MDRDSIFHLFESMEVKDIISYKTTDKSAMAVVISQNNLRKD